MPSPTTRRRLLCSIALVMAALWVAQTTAASLKGVPIMMRIGPDQYRAAPSLWSIAAAPGKIYVAAADGVLIYDGAEWLTVPLPVGVYATIVRRLADGTVMVGGHDTYGRLEYDSVRGYRYVDLLATSGLPEADRRVGPVWEILQTPEGIYLQSQEFIHLLPANGGDTRSWASGPDMRGLMAFGGDLYARIQDQGLGWMRGGELFLVPGGEQFRRTPISAIVGWGGSRFVVSGSGVWRMDDSGVTLAMGWPDGDLPVYATTPLDGGGFAMATLDGEVLVVDAGLRVRQRVVLSEQTISDLARDDEGSLWAVTETEVIRLGIPSPWSIINRTHGLRGLVTDTAEFDGATWVASSRGLFRLTEERGGSVDAALMPWVRLETYGLLADERAMLVAEREGLQQLLPGQLIPQNLHEGEPVYWPQLVRGRTDLAAAHTDREFFLLSFAKDGWSIAHRWPLDGMAITEVIQPRTGEFWISDDRGPPQRWRINLESGERRDLVAYGNDQGLPIDGPDRPKLFFIDGQLSAWSNNKTYRFDESSNRFIETETPDWIRQLAQPGKLNVVETTMGLFAVTPRDLMRRPAATMDWERVQIGGWASTGFGLPRVSRGGVLRVPVWNGVLQYAPDGPVAPLPQLSVFFDQLLVENDSGERESGEVDRGTLSIRSGQPIRMRFSLGTLEPGARYRYRMRPLIGEFSDWADRDLAIRGLEPGDYQFEVEGELPSGRTVQPLALRLLVSPRWYEEPLLRGLLVMVMLAGVVWISRVLGRRRLRRVEVQNRQLEQRIADRTLELERANSRLAEMAVEDPLTGAQNRRALEQAMSREWARCGEQGLPLAALMIDVDQFKRYNDHHGHLEGDRVLIDVAALLRTGIKMPVEVLARYGGEEFTLLLPGAKLEVAMDRAESLRDVVERARVGVTVSIGVAVVYPGPDNAPVALLRLADTALYEAKRLGRNRVVCAGA